MRPARSGWAWPLGAMLAVTTLTGSALAQERATRPGDISVPSGYRIEVAVRELAAPTMVTFDDKGRMLIAESGYCPDPERCPDGPGEPKVTRVETDGSKNVLVRGADFGDELPVTSVAFHDGSVYVAHGGAISVIADGGIRNLITGLPGQGDHQANQIVFKDGFMYFGIGTVTNSGVVGADNAVFGWLQKSKLRQLHDVPCEDIVLTGETFESPNPFTDDPDVVSPLGGQPTVTTSAYAPFGTVHAAGHFVPGSVKCNGAILRAQPDGSDLQVFAWGLRNPYGVEVGPDDEIWATMHGFDARGSRPIEDAWDCLYKIEEGAWYGWPDFACDVPVTDERFKQPNKPQSQFLLQDHPTESPPRPIAKFDPHAATNGFAFSPSAKWGSSTTAYIALFGDFAPATGTVDRPRGTKIVRVDTTSGRSKEFIQNKVPGRASQQSSGGLEHPSDVTFGPDGAMYITDWGIANVSVEGLQLQKDSGVVWKVTREEKEENLPLGPSLWVQIASFVGLAGATLVAGWGRHRSHGIGTGAWAGAVAGLAMGGFAMFVASPILKLPWYAPTRVFATMVMGRRAIANILEFEWAPFILGVVVLMALAVLLGVAFAWFLRTQTFWRVVLAAVLFSLAIWVLVQYLVLPYLFPLVPQRGFPPTWYAFSFGVYGLVLGVLLGIVRPGSRLQDGFPERSKSNSV